MKKLIPFLLLSFMLTISTFAQDKIAKGKSVKILEIDKSDSYYSERGDFVGKDATALGELSKNSSGFYSGTLETSSGRTCFFSNVKLSVNSSSSSSTVTTKPTSTTTSASTSSKSIKFITGTIKQGTSVYLAEISPDDSYYTDRFDKVGRKGKSKTDLTMKEDGYYAGDFTYDDGSTAYFYKAKFSKEPVDKLVKPASTSTTTTPSTNSTTTKSTTDYSDLSYLFGDSSDSDADWNDATNDEDIKSGDKVEITAISSEDSYYDDKSDYIGKKGIAGDDIDFIDDDGGYGGTIKLDNGQTPNFYLVKLKKTGSSSSSVKSTKSSTSSTTTTGTNIPKNTKVLILDVGPNDSYVSSKGTYIRKKGKAVDGLTSQGDDYYSGKVVFDDGTDAYFFNVKVSIIK